MVKNWNMLKILLLALVVFVSACSPKNDTASNDSDGKDGKSEETYEIVMAFPVFGPVPKDMNKIEAAVSEITKEKINATVNFEPISIGAYDQQFNLMLTSNEKLDLLMVSFRTVDGLISKGSLNELDSFLDAHGDGIKNVFEPQYLEAAKHNNKHYIIPNYNEMAEQPGLLVAKRYVDEAGIDLTKVQKFEDLESVFEQIKSNNPTVAPLVPAGVGFSMLDHYRWYDRLGDGIGVLPGFDNDLKVVNLYETPEYAEHLNLLRKWYKAGYIMKDSATNQDSQIDLVKSNRGASMFTGLKPGAAGDESKKFGMEMVTVPLGDTYSTTSNVVGLNWGIPINSQNPEKAFQFLNLMYSDQDIIRLIHFGIEGEHYVEASEGVIDYPEGVDGSTTGYGLNQNFMFGNQFGSGYVWNGSDPGLAGQYKEFNKTAKTSKALGFTFNAEPVRSEYTAVSNVINQYKLSLETGSVEPEEVLPEFITKLKAAGIDRIIEEKQKQLDEWASK
ncbi:ABC transporter substrate-binding protein [Bacillus sp. MRMR6]|uniref:ABC transporter substrate-binding protein n=1 Tax=Bacillus sp. MRMR6 TaxID=1928617 RepID=UPI000951A4B0|nr:ABC transporter substrate-binding protein [Bacillus sp. MRMR6]OLS37271.1 ABC transporter substrate-binding protein [Bacillus sp. MRMR6]